MPAVYARTPEGDARFFRAIENGHSVRDACAAARYGRSSVYQWRRLDGAFAARWRLAAEIAVGLLEDEADRRARDGTDEPVFFRGREAGVRRRYSDGLLLARLKALKPERYGEPLVESVPVIVDPRPEAPQKITVVIRDYLAEDPPVRAVGAINGSMTDAADTRTLSRVSAFVGEDTHVKP